MEYRSRDPHATFEEVSLQTGFDRLRLFRIEVCELRQVRRQRTEDTDHVRRMTPRGAVVDIRHHIFGEVVRRRQVVDGWRLLRSEEHTSELQSLMRISYAVFCLKKQ